MERRKNTYVEFNKILERNYSSEQLNSANIWADELLANLDTVQANALEWNETNSTEVQIPYDYEMYWDFPEPPEICR